MTLYVTSVLFLSLKYSFSVLYVLSFSGASLQIFGSCLHSQLQITVFYCNKIPSLSFYEFYKLVYSLEYVFLVFDILLQSLVNYIVFCIILLHANIQFTLYSFARFDLLVVPVYFWFYFITGGPKSRSGGEGRPGGKGEMHS